MKEFRGNEFISHNMAIPTEGRRRRISNSLLRSAAALLFLLALGFTAQGQVKDSMDMGGGSGGMHLRPDASAPIGVVGDHVLMKGAWSLTYSDMRVEMEGLRSGKDRLTEAQVLQDFMVTPTRMTMDMHMLMAMYGWSEDFSLMAMVPYVNMEMDHLTRTGGRFTTESSGVGDLTVMGILRFVGSGKQDLLLNAGVSVPTGSIDEKDDTPAGSNQQLPYPMQLGSGTYDLLPGLTYRSQLADYSWGAQVGATIRLGENDNDYTLGNRYRLSSWGARKWADGISTSLRIAAEKVSNVDGADPRLNSNVVPTADSNLQGRLRVDVLIGINLIGLDGALKGQRLFFEYGVPIQQDLDGPQLETDWMFTAGARFVF